MSCCAPHRPGEKYIIHMNHSERLTPDERRRFFSFYVEGFELDVDAILRISPFRFDEVIRKGQKKKYSYILQEHYKKSTISKILGDPRELSIPDQDDVTAKFLQKHYKFIKALSDRTDVERLHVGLSPTLKIDLSTLVTGLCLSQELIKLLAELQMSVSLNVVPKIEEWIKEDGV